MADSLPDYVQTANDAILTVILIEHVEAVQHIHDIANTPGLDIAYIASGDLATSMGTVSHTTLRSRR